jgi:hypothetical protein
VEILPSPEQDVVGDVGKAFDRLGKSWFAEPVMLDFGYFDVDEDAPRSPLGIAMDRTEGVLGHPVPVFRLADPDIVKAEVRQAHNRDGNGAALRLIGEDLDVEPDELSADIDTALEAIGAAPADLDLIVDLGAIAGDFAVVGGARLVMWLLRGLDHFSTLRSVTVAAGAFPVDLSAVMPGTLGEHPRDDAAVYNRLQSRPMKRTINFGDYAIAHPLLATGPAFSPPPQVRYTVSDRWLSLKSRRNDPRGHAQIYDLYAQIAAHPDFAGRNLGWADARIADGRDGGSTGNATTWRTVGTVHHADYVVARLTSLGEP